MLDKNKIKLVFIILLFLLFTSWNFSNWLVDTKYRRNSLVSEQIEELKESYPDDKRINLLYEDITFLNSVCFRGQNVMD